MVYGYCRTSKVTQDLALQRDALEKYGVDKIYEEQVSGVKQRPVLESLIKDMKENDYLRTHEITKVYFDRDCDDCRGHWRTPLAD